MIPIKDNYKQMSSDSFKNVISKICLHKWYILNIGGLSWNFMAY